MKKQTVSAVGALLLSIIITILIILFNPAADVQRSIGDWGYAGVFLIMLLSSATVILPAPGLLAVFAAGKAWNIFLVGIAGGVGSALGETTGYLLGYGGKTLILETEHSKNKLYAKTREWMTAHGFITLVILSALPNPLFDVAGIAAGSLGYPLWRFLLACTIGKTIKSIIFAYLGYALTF